VAQRFARRALFGHVAGDFGKAQQLSAGIADRIYHDAGPEAGVALAHAPAFRFETAIMFSGVEGKGRYAARLILRRVEAGKMLADNLVRFIALEPARTCVPADDDAGGIEHVDGVIGNTLDQ